MSLRPPDLTGVPKAVWAASAASGPAASSRPGWPPQSSWPGWHPELNDAGQSAAAEPSARVGGTADDGLRHVAAAGPVARALAQMPPWSFFFASATFRYIGASLAVLLFAHVAVLGVAWLRIASAAVVFAVWRRPWRVFTRASAGQRLVFVALGAVLAVMNCVFYLAVDRLSLGTVGAIEFLGSVILAAVGTRTRRNLLALVLTVSGVVVLSSVHLANQPLGLVFAFANCAGFMIYILLGHRIANTAASGGDSAGLALSGIDQLCLSMIIAAVVAAPFGIVPAASAATHPLWLLYGLGAGVCSSVITYVTDQLAMARLPRSTFSLMLALLPAAATVVGVIVLGQLPTVRDLTGIGIVILGVALHRQSPHRSGGLATDGGAPEHGEPSISSLNRRAAPTGR